VLRVVWLFDFLDFHLADDLRTRMTPAAR